MKYHLTKTHLKILSVILFVSILLTACQSTVDSSTEYISLTKSSIPTKVSSPNTSPTSTLTPTKVLSFTIHGKVFFDFNGNGNYDDGELPISGANISIGDFNLTSFENGDYVLTGIEGGTHKVFIKSPNQNIAESFRYISFSREMFQPIEKPIYLTINSDTELDIALMQGFLTLPIQDNTNCGIGTYYDQQKGIGTKNWMGNNISTGDEHIGVDYRCPKETPIIAAAPGKVEEIIWKDGPTGGYTIVMGNGVSVDGTIEFDTDYSHLTEVRVGVGDKVERGQLLGLSGSWGSYPHLHFGFYAFNRDSSGKAVPLPGKNKICIDPYAGEKSELSYWTKRNEPQSIP